MIRPVKRDGKASHPSIGAHSGSFQQPVRYADGVVLKVRRITQAKMTDLAPGTYPGRPVSTFTLELTNGSRKPVRLRGAVLTMTYGHPSRLAHPVYTDGSRDFSGVVEPGRRATATYSFSVPPAQLGAVTMSIDLDGVHEVASIQGSVKS